MKRTGIRSIVHLVGVGFLCVSMAVTAQQVRQGRVIAPLQTGQGQSTLTDKPMGRINTRIGSRLQSRVNSRIGRNDPSQTGVLSSFQQAEDQIRSVGQR